MFLGKKRSALSETSVRRPVLIYTFHKAASSFLHQLTTELTHQLNLEYRSINQQEFTARVFEIGWCAFINEHPEADCFGPIRLARRANPYLPEDLESFQKVLHVRDPRDATVSLFYSAAFSHVCEEKVFNPSDTERNALRDMGVDAFVLSKISRLKPAYALAVEHLLCRDDVVFLKYEDMVADFRLWLHRFVSPFAAFCDTQVLATVEKELYEQHVNDFAVDAEDIYQHKRQVTPGDHRRKLKPETIDALSEAFGPVLDAFGYTR